VTTFADMVYQLGGAPVGAWLVPPGGTWYFVDGLNGSDSNDGSSPQKALKTVSAAYAKTVTLKNDVVCVLASSTAINETAAIAWSKSLTHLIGLGAPSGINMRTRIQAYATGLSPFITFSGYGCIVDNIFLWQGQDDATSLILASVSGSRNFFRNVHFGGGGHATQAIDGGASLKIDGGSENKFVGCTVGVDTVVAATGMMNLLFDGAASRNVFEDCIFQIYAGATGTGHVEIVDNDGIGRWNAFKRCLFINSCRTYALTGVFVIPGSMTSVTNYIVLVDCYSLGATDWDTNDRGVLVLSASAITGGGTAGLLQASAKT
jgi:hypothetical protein